MYHMFKIFLQQIQELLYFLQKNVETLKNFQKKKENIGKAVGIEENNITIKEYEQYVNVFDVKLVKTNDIIENLRSVKDEEEISEISNVAKKLDKCLENIEKEFTVRNKRKITRKKDNRKTQK